MPRPISPRPWPSLTPGAACRLASSLPSLQPDSRRAPLCYDGWLHGSHHAVATCNDCHLPHDDVMHKFFIKGMNGYHHSKAFTLGGFADPIRIKPGNARVLEANCVRCHEAFVDEITAHGTLGVATDPGQKADLYGCG